MTIITETQAEAIRKYLNEDAQSHIASHGKWSLDSGKLYAAMNSAGIVVVKDQE